MVDEQHRAALLQRALAAAQQGFFVFPVKPGRKEPAHRHWQEQATRDPARITKWFSGAGFNIGISTGASRLLVVDLDDGHGVPPPPEWAGTHHGSEVLARLATAAGVAAPRHTYAVRTPSNGVHLYFRQPPGPPLRNTTGRLGWRIDTRGAGGYVVGAGSVLPQGHYRPAGRPLDIADLPPWLHQLLTRRPEPHPAPLPAPLHTGRLQAYVAAAVRGECRAVEQARLGTRHHTLLRAARILGEFVGGGSLPLTVARAALRTAADHHTGVEGWTHQHADQTIEDGLAYGQDRPRQLPRN